MARSVPSRSQPATICGELCDWRAITLVATSDPWHAKMLQFPTSVYVFWDWNPFFLKNTRWFSYIQVWIFCLQKFAQNSDSGYILFPKPSEGRLCQKLHNQTLLQDIASRFSSNYLLHFCVSVPIDSHLVRKEYLIKQSKNSFLIAVFWKAGNSGKFYFYT